MRRAKRWGAIEEVLTVVAFCLVCVLFVAVLIGGAVGLLWLVAVVLRAGWEAGGP